MGAWYRREFGSDIVGAHDAEGDIDALARLVVCGRDAWPRAALQNGGGDFESVCGTLQTSIQRDSLRQATVRSGQTSGNKRTKPDRPAAHVQESPHGPQQGSMNNENGEN
jgi:hypothetical protein